MSYQERRPMEELDEHRNSVVRDALEAYAWRSLAPDVLARVVLAARDRHRVEVLLGELAGTVTGAWLDLAPVEPDDIRIGPVTELLEGRPWREMPLEALVPEILGDLHTWWFRWQWRLGDENTRPADEDA
jgi:hypothetical protein